MGASFAAELLKLRKRPATWVLALVWFGLVVLFGYVLTYLIFVNASEGTLPPGTNPEEFVSVLYPENLLTNVLSGFPNVGGAPIALILGALAVGSEYGWGTFKMALTQRPGKLRVFFGKMLALVVVLAVFVLLAFGAGAASSFVLARLEEAPVNWPAAGDLLRATGVGLLICAVWTAMGAFLATLFRGTPLAIGLGLVYAILLEGLAATLLAANEDFDSVRKFLLNENSYALINSFGSSPEGLGVSASIVEPERAVLILIAYVAAFFLLAGFVFWRRDVT